MEFKWIQLIIIMGALVIGFTAFLVTKKPDGYIEQTAEAVLRSQGIDIDISPE